MAGLPEDLKAAAQAGIITSAQADALSAFVAQREQPYAASQPAPAGSRFDLVHVLWYAGALIVMSAMGLFSTLAFSQMGGGALAVTAVIYAVLFTLTGHHLWTRKNLRTPGGLLIAIAVSMAALAVYGIQDATGSWTRFGSPGQVRDFYVWIKGSFIFMELAAIAAAVVALRFYRFPFIVMIAAIALWFMSMDLAPWLTSDGDKRWDVARQVSIWFGLAVIVVAMAVNLRQRSGDFAFWLYLVGVATFWGGITMSPGGTAMQKALYAAMNVGFLGLSVFLNRRVFALFGTIGIAIYLGDLAAQVFKDSLLFPFALSLIGIAVIALGLWLHRREDALRTWMDARLPQPLQALRTG